MKILAIETATDICGIAYINDGKCIGLVEKKTPRAHAEKLPLFYEKLIKETGIKLRNIDGIAVSFGPGSFTGLRIGLSYCKGLAFSQGISVIPVPTLESLVFAKGKTEGTIRILLHSHRETFFQQDFLWEREQLQNISEIDVLEWNELKCNFDKKQTTYFYGGEHLVKSLNEPGLIKVHPSANWIGFLAEKNFTEWVSDNPFTLTPDYISPFLMK